MKRLTIEELNWISLQLKSYKISFKEVYAEVFDHIVSAIELKRSEGDEQEISILFEQTVNADFNGRDGIKKIVWERTKFLQRALWQKLMVVIRTNRPVTLGFSMLVLALIGLLPVPVKSINVILACTCFVLAFMPIAYLLYFNGAKSVFTDKSIKLRVMANFAFYAMYMFNFLFCTVFGLVRIFADHFKAMNCNPLILATLLVCLLAYNINFIQFYNYEFGKETI